MTPAHTKIQPDTLATLIAAFDPQRLGSFVKFSAWKAFYHTRATIQTVANFLVCRSNAPEMYLTGTILA
jgi:hypothetical protein